MPGTKVEMPFWMARALCSSKRHIVAVDTPKNYKDSYREILTADANVVDLHKLGPYYYCFGTHLLKFEQPDSADIAKSLVKVRKIMEEARLSQISYSAFIYITKTCPACNVYPLVPHFYIEKLG